MTEENAVVSKVGELMEALDNIKKYSAFAVHLRRFATILGASIVAYLTLRITFIDYLPETQPHRLLSIGITLAVLLIPISGFIIGILYVSSKVNSVKPGLWREELAQGFPGALKILTDLDWNRTMDEISVGKLGYLIYGVLKSVGYWFLTYFVLDRLVYFLTLFGGKQLSFVGNFLVVALSLIIVFLIVGNDFVRRYKEVNSLDMLLWELRGLSLEFKRTEFKA